MKLFSKLNTAATKYYGIAVVAVVLSLSSCDKSETPKEDFSKVQDSLKTFLTNYNTIYQDLIYKYQEADWQLNIKIVEGDTVSANLAKAATEAFTNFTGSKLNIEQAKYFLDLYEKNKDKFTETEVRQLEAILYYAGANPETAADIVKQKIAADTKQTENLFGFTYKIDGKPVTTNEIDNILSKETDLTKRLKAWEASKEVGVKLKDGLANLQTLRNKSVQALGYSDYFNYQVSEYKMTSEEMMTVCRDMIKEIWPIYRELHTWARYELAKKYKQPTPNEIPAHWLPNRWGQEWNDLVDVKGIDLDKTLAKQSPEWIIKKGEEFYVSLGFSPLPASFYEKSSLYPLAANSPYKKNNHASAWHMNNAEDVRSLMSVEANTKWWGTTLHELGHIYYYMTYSNPDVPIVLRNGANRAYHEAMGTMIGLASLQQPFLEGLGLVPAGTKVDQTQVLLKEALDYIVVLPWAAGVMTEFEYELYSKNLPKDQYNKKWWELVKKYQGIVPPTERGEQYCDAATKTHINNDAAQYYDYAMANVLLFQFHEHIAKNILKQDPHNTNYWGSKATGDFVKKLMYPGANVDWRQHLKETLGSEFSAKSIANYFAPLMPYLKEQNKGRTHTLPEKLN